MKRLAYIFERKGTLFGNPWCFTDDGMVIGSPEFEAVALPATPEAVGRLVEWSLANSRTDVRRPSSRSQWDEVTRPLLNAAGVKTWAGFARYARAVSIDLDETLLFTPMARDERNAHYPLRDLVTRLAMPASVEQIGEAALAALSHAE
jgi:hypothetical protein